MKYLLLLLVSLPTFAFNDWRIQCKRSLDNGDTITISDERISGDTKNRLVEISLWSQNKLQWTGGGRVFVSKKKVRENVFFLKGKRVDYKLTYVNGFDSLPSESRVDLNEFNSTLKLVMHEGISSSTPVESTTDIELACYYRKGGE